MYFFRIELSSFDDVKKVFFILPDQQAVDESGPPFSEKQLIASQHYKTFVKETKTSVVDVNYTLYNTSSAISGEITNEQFVQMEQDGTLEKLDGNELSLSSGKSAKSSGKNNDKFMLFIIAIIAVVIVILIVAVGVGKGDKTESDVFH